MARVLDGWFADRVTGRGKPVYSSGTIIVPTNGIVGRGVSSAPVLGTFVPAAPAIVSKSVLDAWQVDRAPGRGKPVGATFANGITGLGFPPANFVTNQIHQPINGSSDFIDIVTLDRPPNGTVNLNWYCGPTKTPVTSHATCQGNQIVFKSTNTCGDLSTSTIDVEQTTGTTWISDTIPYLTPPFDGVAYGLVSNEEFGFGIGEHAILWSFQTPPTNLSNDGFTVVTPNVHGGSFTASANLTFTFPGPVTTPIPVETRLVITSGSGSTTYTSGPLDIGVHAPSCAGNIVHATITDIPGPCSALVKIYVPEDIFNDFIFVSGDFVVQWIAG